MSRPLIASYSLTVLHVLRSPLFPLISYLPSPLRPIIHQKANPKRKRYHSLRHRQCVFRPAKQRINGKQRKQQIIFLSNAHPQYPTKQDHDEQNAQNAELHHIFQILIMKIRKIERFFQSQTMRSFFRMNQRFHISRSPTEKRFSLMADMAVLRKSLRLTSSNRSLIFGNK